MNGAVCLVLAVAADLLFGDPACFPHPVRAMGGLALALERRLRRLIANERSAGVVTVLAVLLATGAAAAGLLALARLLPWPAAELTTVVLLYFGLAARDMLRHSSRVHTALAAGDLEGARRQVQMIVGRDTEEMNEEEIVRATVESVAENLVDGVTAPLFYAMLGGPVAILLYKAASTMDSTFGYRNERYREFGWAAARLDDLLNLLPARLTGMVMVAAAALLALQPAASWRILRRDRLRHASPNSGHPEAAMAGALGVRLGGPAAYAGILVRKPTIGDPLRSLAAQDILRANRLFLASAILAAFLAVTSSSALVLCIGG
jgi:adenosylcobinamide-phosphate synthase